MKKLLYFLIAAVSLNCQANKTLLNTAEERYPNAEIVKKLENLPQQLSEIVGQQDIIEVLVQRLREYFINRGNNIFDLPATAIHLIGLPGIGKTALISKTIEYLGLKDNFHVIDAQDYMETGKDLSITFTEIANKPGVKIFFIDELDKLSEVLGSQLSQQDDIGVFSKGETKANAFIGLLNQLTTKSSVSIASKYGVINEIKNTGEIFLITAMNLPEPFLLSGTDKKSLFELDIDDLQKLVKNLQVPGGIPHLLTSLFQANTVGRLAANAYVMNSLTRDDHLQIIKNIVEKLSDKISKTHRNVSISYDNAFLDYLFERAVTPATGARDTSQNVYRMFMDLVQFGTYKVLGKRKKTTLLKREIHISIENNEIKESVNELTRNGNRINLTEFTILYDKIRRIFIKPEGIDTIIPEDIQAKITESKKKIPTRGEIQSARFPNTIDIDIQKLAKELKEEFFGLDAFIIDTLNAFFEYKTMGKSKRDKAITKTIVGLENPEKRRLIEKIAEKFKVEFAFLDISLFLGKDGGDNLVKALSNIYRSDFNKDIIIIFDNLKTLSDLDASGNIQKVPVLETLKNLLEKGYSTVYEGSVYYSVYINKAMIYLNFNMDSKHFKWSPDPRITTSQNVKNDWGKFIETTKEFEKYLDTLFSRDSQNIFSAGIYVIKDNINKTKCLKIISRVIQETFETFINPDNLKSWQLTFETTERYKDYIFQNFYIPSEGLQSLIKASAYQTQKYLSDMFALVQRNSHFNSSPLKVTLDFNPKKNSEQLGHVYLKIQRMKGETPTKEKILSFPVYSRFPTLAQPDKVSFKRILKAIHEFGHAYVNVLLGKRFDHIFLEDIGGDLNSTENKPEHLTGSEILVEASSLLGSLVFERLFLFTYLSAPVNYPENVVDFRNLSTFQGINIRNQTSRQIRKQVESESARQNHRISILAKLNLTSSATKDHQKSIEVLREFFNRLDVQETQGEEGYKLRMMFNNNQSNLNRGDGYSNIKTMIFALETYIEGYVAFTHDYPWYVSKIKKLAKQGQMSEKEFYHLVEVPYSPDDLYTEPSVSNEFLDILENLDLEPEAFIYGNDKKSHTQRIQELQHYFEENLPNMNL